MISKYISSRNHRKTFITLWLTYASFYLCRVNISIAIPRIIEELNFSFVKMGMLGSVFFVVYAAGQIVNGLAAGRRSPRKIIITGIIGSAVVNILFGTSSIFPLMLVLWGLNAYFQSAGWSPSVKIVSNWFSEKKSGTVSGLFGASYHFGNAVSWLIAGGIALLFSWRMLFFLPALLFLLSGLHFLLFVRDHPEAEAVLKTEHKQGQAGHSYAGDFLKIVKDPRILQVGIASMFLGITAYGFLYWIPSYLYKERSMSLSAASFNALCFPLAGALGAIAAGWASDRFFRSKRKPVTLIMISCAVFLTFLFPYLSAAGRIMIIPVLLLLGFMVDGPHILFGMTFAIDYGKERAAAIAGFVNSLNYLGSAAGIFVTGQLISRFGWQYVFYFWTGSLILSAAVISVKKKFLLVR
ncbi:MAG: MFS transporter [Candidatus Omnitrophica bacterium]|nr:MFS transporter [Candidatus Omnitrophota bacterium]